MDSVANFVGLDGHEFEEVCDGEVFACESKVCHRFIASSDRESGQGGSCHSDNRVEKW